MSLRLVLQCISTKLLTLVLERGRVDLNIQTAWTNKIKNGISREFFLNVSAVSVLQLQVKKHAIFCFIFTVKPIGYKVSNNALRNTHC